MTAGSRRGSAGTARRSAAFAHVDTLAGSIDRLATIDPDDLPVPELAGLIQQLDKQRNRLDATVLTLTAAFDQRNGAREVGERDTTSFLRNQLRRRPGDAKRTANAAQALGGLDQTRQALGRGDISAEHAAEIADATAGLDDPDAETKLLTAARRGDPSAVRNEGKRLIDRQQAADRARRAYDNRRLDFRDDPAGGTRLEGYGPNLAGELIQTGIDALAAPRGEDDHRTAAQRRWDALIELVERAGAAKKLPDDGGDRPVLLALLPLDELEQRAGAEPGTLPRTGPLDPQALEQLACRTVAVNGRSGSAGRSPETRAARWFPLRFGNHRWRGFLRSTPATSVAPTCGAHHEPPWPIGATDIDKMALICNVNHWMRHHGGWSLEISADATVTVTSPDGRIVLTETAAEARRRHMGTDLTGDTGERQRRARPGRPEPPRHDGADPPRPQPEPRPGTATSEATDPPDDTPTLPGIASEDHAVYRAA